MTSTGTHDDSSKTPNTGGEGGGEAGGGGGGSAAQSPPTATSGIAVPPELRHQALARLLGGGSTVPDTTIQSFLDQAPDLGIDLALLAAAVRGDGPSAQVRQVCLPVVGAGRTVMLFVSGGVGGGPPEASAERAAAIREGVRLATEAYGERAHLAQALAQPRERWAAASFEAAGLERLTILSYLARTLQPRDAEGSLAPGNPVKAPEKAAWPGAITVHAMDGSASDEARLRQALDASYEDTMDCPELAGLRTIEDIVAAHRDVGEFDPALWWIIERDSTPLGCLLLNRCPAQTCVELVYIGVAPALRGLGLGRLLLRRAITAASPHGRELRCAVDERNTPARHMYTALGFRETERRVAYVALVQDMLGKQGKSRA
ncbi:MAG: GNAT family N-acetyltransferase [Planctomycetota bacterium]|nr:GNAT family N-acetyltransferase [Planctomycetota bacterium]